MHIYIAYAYGYERISMGVCVGRVVYMDACTWMRLYYNIKKIT